MDNRLREECARLRRLPKDKLADFAVDAMLAMYSSNGRHDPEGAWSPDTVQEIGDAFQRHLK